MGDHRKQALLVKPVEVDLTVGGVVYDIRYSVVEFSAGCSRHAESRGHDGGCAGVDQDHVGNGGH